jgi:hypothetical protein
VLRGGRARDHEDAGADDAADADHDQVEGTKRAVQVMLVCGDRIGFRQSR